MKSVKPVKIFLVSIGVTVFFLSVLIFVSNAGSRMANRIIPLMHASMSIKYHASIFHREIEELEEPEAGSKDVGKEAVFKHLATAKMYAAKMLSGGRVPEGYTVLPVEDRNIRAITKDVIRNLNNLEKPSRERIATDRDNGNPAAREKFHKAITHTMDDIEKIGTVLKKNIASQLRLFRTLSYAMGFLVILFGMLTSFAASRYWQKRETEAKALGDSEERNRRIVESSLDAIITIDDKGCVMEFSPSAVKMFGYTEDEMKGRDVAELIIPPRLRDKHRQSLERYLKTGHKTIIGQRVELSAVHSDGREFPIELMIAAVEMRGRQYFTAFINDMTKRKRAEKALMAQKELFHAIAASAYDAIIMMDNKGDLVFANKAVDRMFGYDKGELIGKSVHQTIAPKAYYKKFSVEFRKFIETGQGDFIGKTLELPAIRKDGTEFFADHSFSAVRLDDKWHSVVIIRDTTERRQAEDELKKARDEAENANRYKSEFLAAMSHDLRTPLNAIMGFSEMMETHTFGPLGDPHYDEYARDIYNSGKLLVSLINGILDISKIEAGKYELTEEPVNMELLVDSSVNLIARRSVMKNIIIRTDIKPGLPMLYADDRALSQILNNFLSNAVKFTAASGKITISADVESDGAIIMQIIDNGIGMNSADITKALRPFEQADSSQPRKHEGTGLGLYICSSLMKLHGGSMEIDSVVGVGTTVTLRFPPQRTVGYQ